MRYLRFLLCLLVMCTVSSCVAPALMLSPQSQLLWALLKPMVGLDPNESNLLEQPMIKSRLQPLLGDNYDTAVTLLSTATELQQQGPMFFLVSKHSPLPDVAEKAGFVWNSDTNQMAVLLVSGGAPTVFAEQVKKEGAKVLPQWPDELVEFTDPALLREKALAKAAATITTQLPLEGDAKALTTTAIQSGDFQGTMNNAITTKKQAVIDELKAPIEAPLDSAKQHIEQKIENKKQVLQDQVKSEAKQLVGRPELSEEDALAAELSAERTAISANNQPDIQPTDAELLAIKNAEIRVEQANVLLKAAKEKEQSATDKVQAKLLVLAAKEQLQQAQTALATAKAAVGKRP